MIHSEKILVKNSPLGGLGVFAKQDIKAGEILEEVPFLVLPPSLTLGEKLCKLLEKEKSLSSRDIYLENLGANLGFKHLNKYWFKWTPKESTLNGENIFFSVIPLGFACLYNTSNANSNAGWTINGNIFTFSASRDIKEEEEIKTFYGYLMSEDGADWSVNSVFNLGLEKRDGGVLLESLKFENQNDKEVLLKNKGLYRLDAVLNSTPTGVKILKIFSVDEDETPTSSVIIFSAQSRLSDYYATLKTFKSSGRSILLEFSFFSEGKEKTEKVKI